jgi:hypothetical protein
MRNRFLMTETIQVPVECPLEECRTKKDIQIPAYLFDNKRVGLIKVQVHHGVCCEHQFVVFLDKKGIVKGYEKIDVEIDLSQIQGRTLGPKVFLKDLLQQYKDVAAANMLHAIITNYPVIILTRGIDVSKAMNKLFNDFLPEKYQIPFIVTSIPEIDFKKAQIENALVINPDGLIANIPWTDIAMTFEASLIKQALEILDDESQAVIIQTEIETLIKKAEYIYQIINKEKQIYEDDLMDLVKKQFNLPSMNNYEIILLKQVVNRKLKGDVAKIKIRSFDRLKEGLW